MCFNARQEQMLVPHGSSGFQHPSALLEQAVGEEAAAVEEQEVVLLYLWHTAGELAILPQGQLFWHGGPWCLKLTSSIIQHLCICSYCSFYLQYFLIKEMTVADKVLH